ncbi:unnamed protein product [Psylliodes chrysocephalus]|uniref:Tc1-like transposase DDE domain-containing protein n=1 Tax=Psylliodes chrysocephalus TaxID=3402493 RepID=A0A9P0DCV4_9CUCU|nr:unnamed protein product [Psylliodes chrysocephala]
MIHNVRQQLHIPPQSPDVRPIEQLWEELKRRVRKRSSKGELKNRVFLEWENIPAELTRKLVSSMTRRLQAIIKAICLLSVKLLLETVRCTETFLALFLYRCLYY